MDRFNCWVEKNVSFWDQSEYETYLLSRFFTYTEIFLIVAAAIILTLQSVNTVIGTHSDYFPIIITLISIILMLFIAWILTFKSVDKFIKLLKTKLKR